MNWPDERYVRVYTRDTLEWQALPWQSRAVWLFLLRRLDRSGVLEVRPGPDRLRMISTAIGVPQEIVEVGVAGLLVDGCLLENEFGFVAPNFIEAQEAKASDASANGNRGPTAGREVSRGSRSMGKTSGSQNVTKGHKT